MTGERDEPRDRCVATKLTRSERRRLALAARAARVTVSEYVRLAVMETADEELECE